MILSEVKVEDGRWARPLLERNGFRSCEFNFVDIYMWSVVYRTRIGRFEDYFILRNQDDKRLYYLYPPGEGDRKAALRAILEDALEAGKPPVIFSIPPDEVDALEKMFPGAFDFTNPRAQTDYIYNTEDLAELRGRKFQKKRNLCSRFERDNPGWEFKEITPDAVGAVSAFNNRWCNLYDNRDDAGIIAEHQAIERVFRHYDELKLKGGYITLENEVIAFSFGSPLGPDMFVTHVEKAQYDITGAYNVINREMARRFCQGKYAFINRENDEGEEGLREAKRTYQPALLEEKFWAYPRRWPMEPL